MADARGRHNWSHTSSLMSLIANCHRDQKKSNVIYPHDFDPYAKKREPVKADISILKDVFIDGKMPNEPER